MKKMIVSKNGNNYDWFVDDTNLMIKEAVKQGYEVISVTDATPNDLLALMLMITKPEPVRILRNWYDTK